MIVSDTSPFIALTRTGRLDLLRQLYGEVSIPPAGEQEISRHPAGFGGNRPSWVSVRQIENIALRESLRARRLGPGEAEAISLAIELGARLLIDEGPGRLVARSLGLDMTGTMGALLEAKQTGLLSQLDPVLTQIRSAGFRVSDRLVAEILLAAGE